MQTLYKSNGNVYQELYACPEILEVFKGGCISPHPVCIRVSASSKSGFYGLKNLKFVQSLEKVLNLLEALYLKFYVFGL